MMIGATRTDGRNASGSTSSRERPSATKPAARGPPEKRSERHLPFPKRKKQRNGPTMSQSATNPKLVEIPHFRVKRDTPDHDIVIAVAEAHPDWFVEVYSEIRTLVAFRLNQTTWPAFWPAFVLEQHKRESF